MQPIEQTARAAQREVDHQRWADDGGVIPDSRNKGTETGAGSPWTAVGIAAALGFALGWLISSARKQ